MFPRINTALSTYFKNSRRRTGASVALTIAAAAGVGAASTAAGAQPWTASLNNMAQAGHSTAGPTAKKAGQNIFAAALGAEPASSNAGTHSTSAAQVTDQRQDAATAAVNKPAAKSTAPSQHAGVQALKPVSHPAAPKPVVPAGHPSAQSKPLAAKPAQHKAAPAPAPKPYTIYDSVTPGQIPSGQQQVAVYGDGAYQASWGSVHGRHRVLWIDTNGSNTGCDVLDVEPGDASPAASAQWAHTRLNQQPHSIAVIYTMLSEWSAVKSAIGTLPGAQQSHVRYWIADPTGVPHVVPGSSATQWYWGSNYDITKALPNFDS